jgi:hypothetical protein
LKELLDKEALITLRKLIFKETSYVALAQEKGKNNREI